MRTTVLQVGARRNYALPRFLSRTGMLQRLYTDVAFGSDSVAAQLIRRLPTGRITGKLRRRIVADVPSRLIDNDHRRRRDNRYTLGEPWALSPRDLQQSDIFYTQYFAGANGLKNLLRHDQRVVSDVFTVPATHHVVNAEAERFPDWAEPTFDAKRSRAFDTFTLAMLDQSDALFCPAQSVVDAVAEYGEHYRAKCWVVPFGASLKPVTDVAPRPKRVLFAGRLTLRKGVQYLRAAADLLRVADPAIEIVVAGIASPEAAAMMAGPNVTLTGQLSREGMAHEFATADLFVFPTLAEGSAGVVLEAMAAGLPVVMTNAAGVDLHDRDAAIIVPERSIEELAAAILRVVEDRPLREHMSQAARRNATRYGDTEWAALFLDSLRRVGAGEQSPVLVASEAAVS